MVVIEFVCFLLTLMKKYSFPLLFCSIDLQDYENLGVASTFKNLILMFPVSLLDALPRDLLTVFINHMTRLTCDMGKNAAMEEAVSEVCVYEF